MSEKTQDEEETTGQSAQQPAEGSDSPGNETEPPQGQSSEEPATG